MNGKARLQHGVLPGEVQTAMHIRVPPGLMSPGADDKVSGIASVMRERSSLRPIPRRMLKTTSDGLHNRGLAAEIKIEKVDSTGNLQII